MVTMARLKAVTADGLTALHVAIACGQREVEQPTKWWAGNNWETSWQWDLASVWDLCFFSVAGLKVKICVFSSASTTSPLSKLVASVSTSKVLQLWLAKLLLLLLLNGLWTCWSMLIQDSAQVTQLLLESGSAWSLRDEGKKTIMLPVWFKHWLQ